MKKYLFLIVSKRSYVCYYINYMTVSLRSAKMKFEVLERELSLLLKK